MKNNRRPQTPKRSNPELARAMQGLRMSSAAEPHRNKSKYDRKDYRRERQNGFN